VQLTSIVQCSGPVVLLRVCGWSGTLDGHQWSYW